ncbi:MAG TPA: FGGY family carbohydrate kinase [Solirubrobacteraceae bacterium]|nr:FGGY family carbohydrate kinase [Solirubrobacteraceae bacterium]
MILAIDQGTTGTTCLVFDEDGEVAGRAYREFEQHSPRPGWVEHDAREIWDVTRGVAADALDDAGTAELHAIGITNQRETVCVWDPKTGEPLHRALVGQDRRTADRCTELREAGREELVRAKTGLTIDPSFSATKIAWLLRNVDGLADNARSGRAVFGTVDAWLIFNLTGELATDQTNASRTLLCDRDKTAWDPELLDVFGIPANALPKIVPSIGEVGRTRDDALPGWDGVPVSGIAGDQQAALYGQACLDPGQGKSTYPGTGSSLLLNVGDRVPKPPPGVLATVAWAIGQRTFYALEASTSVPGAAMQGPRGGSGIPSETEGLARATLEATAFQTLDCIRVMDIAATEPLRELRADGGASENAWLMQFQADVLGVPVVVPEVTQTTAMGAAFLAGVGCGRWTQGEVRRLWREGARYEPAMSEDERSTRHAEWTRAVERARGWAAG